MAGRSDDIQLDFELLRRQRPVRLHLAYESHYYFFNLYMSAYVRYATAQFQRDMYDLTQDDAIRFAVIVAFRGSGKSTIMTQSYPMWAILGKPQKKFVVILSQTQTQARSHLLNIKREFEGNDLLRSDYGPMEEETDEWGSSALLLSKFNARLVAASTEQAIRGIRHGACRPDLIIADDVEDMSSVKTMEGRNKTYDWFTGDILPLGDVDTKVIAIGNLLHEDSLLMRLKAKIENHEIDGVYREWPITQDGRSLWPGKYPDQQAIEQVRRSLGNTIAWEREYKLRIIPDEDQIIDPKWIRYYDELPDREDENNEYVGAYISVDLAISQSHAADNTAIVIIHAYGRQLVNRRYYLDSRFVNHRLTHLQTLETIRTMCCTLAGEHEFEPQILVEQVQYQAAVVEQLEAMGLPTIGIKIHNDKRARLQLASPLFEQNKIYLPKTNKINVMVQQLLGFGVERYDDLVDAITMGLNHVQSDESATKFFDFDFD